MTIRRVTTRRRGSALAGLFRRGKPARPPPASLEARLAGIDRDNDFRRLYVMGCGRSGTWLLTALFATFADVDIVASELPVTDFARLATDRRVLILKRHDNAYQTVEKIPPSIGIAMIVRHPFAVLTSHNPTTRRKYHIDPDRWLGEMLALQYLVDTKRRETTIVRYEDLVADPEATQALLGNQFGLTVQHAAGDVHKVFNASPEAISAMHGLRPIDAGSVESYRQSAEKMSYLRSIRPRLGRLLDWVSGEYGYDISL